MACDVSSMTRSQELAEQIERLVQDHIAASRIAAAAAVERAFAATPVAERDTWRHMIQTFREGLRVIRARPPLRRILAVGVFYGLYSEAWDRLWQVHLITSVGLPKLGALPAVVWLSAIMVAEMLVGIAAGEALRRRLDLTDGAAMARGCRRCALRNSR